MQILFLWDTAADADESMARQLINDSTTEDELRAAALEWSKATWEQRDSIDRWVGQVAPQWPPNRQPIVDRNLLRLAVWELTNTPTPPKVVIDEAIELAKVFSTEQSARFVNGVLDKILKEHRKLTGDPHVTEKLNGADATATNPEET